MDRKQILEDTIKYYSEDTNRRCVTEYGCFYNPIRVNKKGITDGCAIGRLIPQRLRAKLDKFDGATGVIEYKIFQELPKKIQNLGQDFLVELQILHDNNSYWDDGGLTEKGEKVVTEMKRRYEIY